MTAAQQQKVKAIAQRFGCWPDDVSTQRHGALLDVTIGVQKGRRKHFTLTEQGTVLVASEVRGEDG